MLAPLTLSNARGEGLVLSADGTLTVAGDAQPIGRLLSDGSFVGPEGSVRVRLAPDGTLHRGDGSVMPVTIDRTGTIHATGAGELSFRADGSLEGGNSGAPATRIDGLTLENRRTAAFMLILAAFPSH